MQLDTAHLEWLHHIHNLLSPAPQTPNSQPPSPSAPSNPSQELSNAPYRASSKQRVQIPPQPTRSQSWNTPTPAAEPPASSHQSPPTALPSPGERRPPISLFGGIMDAASAKLRDVAMVALFRGPYNVVVGGDRDGGGAEALARGTAETHEERVAAGEEAAGSVDGVEGAAVGGCGLQACVGTWGGEMEERAAEAARAILERKRAKDELVELGKEHEALKAETERLRVRFVEMVKQGKRQAEDWRDPLWLTANGVLQQFDSAKAEGERVGAKLKRARKQLERTEKVAERMILELGRVMGGERESVAAVAGVEVEVEVAEVEVEEQEEDAEVETRSEEVVREVARD